MRVSSVKEAASTGVTLADERPQVVSRDEERSRAHRSEGTMVMPLVRGLAILSAFTPRQAWMSNQEIALETDIPTPTVSRMLRSLVSIGYLRYSPERRKYRLAASILSLGYAAIAHSNVQRLARVEMQTFADSSDSYVVLATRERLDVIVLETCASRQTAPKLDLSAGMRLRIASSPMGWALLAALPELERFYLLGNIERKMGRQWPHLRRRIGEGISQVQNQGFCSSFGEWEPELVIVAAPLTIADHTPLVLACVGRSSKMARARVDRELGPRLVATATSLQDKTLFTE
jgi:DNA-binding IclR family transcriptional regulator